MKPCNVELLLPWEEIEKSAQDQIINSSWSTILDGNICIMPDCHYGIGATVGAVIPTARAIIPAAVGVDIGCGMEAIKLPIDTEKLNDKVLNCIFSKFCEEIPLGAGGRTADISESQGSYWHSVSRDSGITFSKQKEFVEKFSDRNPAQQLGTLGSGNHFIELCLDESNEVWLMLHSGSRGIGNRIGSFYIEKAKQECIHLGLPDSNLSFLSASNEGVFSEYIFALNWAQNYAYYNRQALLYKCVTILNRLRLFTGTDDFWWRGNINNSAVSCHHNYVEILNGNRFITRKGAISAKKGELGIIPGSMGTKSYIVKGLGNEKYLNSASHGAGRRMSRGDAKRRFSVEDLSNETKGIVCKKDSSVLDEIPSAYKEIDLVIERQSENIEIVHILKQILNVKG